MTRSHEKFKQRVDSAFNSISANYGKGKVDVAIYAALMTPEEAEVACNLTAEPLPAVAIAERAGKSPAEVETVLDKLASNGAIFKMFTGVPLYCLAPFAPGTLEFLVKDMGPEMAKMLEDHFLDYAPDLYRETGGAGMRVIPVKESIEAHLDILTFEQVESMIDNSASVALTDCVCRMVKKHLGEACDAPIKEICIILGVWADYFEKTNRGRKVSKEEAKAKLREGAEAGLVSQTFNVQEGSPFICNCCGCCCVGLRPLTEFGIASSVGRSSFIAEVAAAACQGCGACVTRCHFKALAMDDGLLSLQEERCVGCGLCVVSCAFGALSMKKREGHLLPPKTPIELSMSMHAGVAAHRGAPEPGAAG